MKKFLALIFLALLPMLASAYDAQINGIYYNFSGNEATVTSGSSEYSGDVVIPGSVIYNGTTYSVTSIGDYAFSGCRGLTSITIGNNVTSIGKSSFWVCSRLTSITIPTRVTSIGESVFRDCSGLTSVTIPNSVTSIGIQAFYNCSALTSITIPNCVTGIGSSTFSGCLSLTSVTIPNSVTSIGWSAFSGCSGLTSITIPNSVTSIGSSAFLNCYFTKGSFINYSALTSSNNWGATLCDEETDDGLLIKDNTVVKCRPWTTTATFPNSVTEIGANAFSYCPTLTSITIPNSVTIINGYAFLGCSGLTSVTIPNSVTFISNGVFSGCSSLKSIKVETGNINYDSRNNCNAIIETSTNTLKYGCQNTVIPNNVATIGEGAFCGCSGLTSITIPNSVTSIGRQAFKNCSGLTSIDIPNGVTSIDEAAFEFCYGLTSITIPNCVTSIGNSVFQYCTSLTSVTIPNSVTSIGSWAFSGCSVLTSVVSKIQNPFAFGNNAFANISSICVLTIPSGTQRAYIDSGWTTDIFKGGIVEDDSDPSIIFADANVKVLCVAKWDLNGNGELSESEAEAVTGLCEVFKNRSDITSFEELRYFTGLTSIGNEAFRGCSGLKSIAIPNSVTSIGDYAFYGCNISSVYITDLIAWCNISFSYSSNPLNYDWVDGQRIPHHLYLNGQEITDLVIPDGLTSVADYAFDGCSSLTSVTIPNSVTSIGRCAFYDCTSLTSVTIGENVTSIGGGAFQYMDGKSRNLSAKVYVNRGSDALLAVWNYAKSEDGYRILPYETGTSQILYPSYLSAVSKTQTTITYRINYAYSDLEYECSANGNPLGDDEYIITGLRPDYKQAMSLTVRSANCTFINRIKEGIKTLSISPTISNEGVTASSISLKGSYTEGDANVISHSVVIDESEMAWDEGTLYGLDPNTLHNCKYIVVVEYGDGNRYSYEASKKITTAELSLTALQPKVISEGNVILAAQTSLGDEETNAGFEWRRIEWTEEFDSKYGSAIVYEGMMEGYFRSINSSHLWKFRPYYTSNAGNTYYGEWKGLDPSDYSYFEPTVRTSATVNVNGVSAEVKGYVMRGTDNVTSQGFMYWENGSPSSRRRANGIPTDAVTVTASGNVMKAQFEDLDYETRYCYVAFATTSEGETFYGEVQTFTTDASPYIIGDLNCDGKVDIADAVTELNIMASSEYNKAADLNGDNKNDIADFVTVLNIMAGQGGEGSSPIVGTWEWREGDTYIRVTLNENGTYSVTGFVDGGNFSGSGNYTYTDGYLILTGVDMGADKIKVVSLTSTTLVLQNFPNEGNCTFYRK